MNLLYLSSLGGGLDTNVRVLSPALVERGHRVSVLYLHAPGAAMPRPNNGIEGCAVYHATTGGLHYYVHRALLRKASLPRLVRTFENTRTLEQVIAGVRDREGLDLVELPEGLATPMLKNNVPRVLRLHSLGWAWRKMLNEPAGIAYSIERLLEGSAMRRTAGISSPSVMLAELVDRECGLGGRQIEIIPYPIDTAQFAPASERAEPPLILYVGRVERRKGAATLLRAIPRVQSAYPNCQFVFAGQVNNDVKAEIAAVQSSRVQFLGPRPRDELVGYYQRAAIFAAPSLWDNSPNTVYEAMSCGSPVVASRVGGIPELVDDGVTGLLVPPGDSHSLADAICSLLANRERREQMGRRGREKAVDQFAIDKIVSRTLDFYRRVTQTHAVEAVSKPIVSLQH
jgi:glycosyltransferase involved in cell wall biosynthesis